LRAQGYECFDTDKNKEHVEDNMGIYHNVIRFTNRIKAMTLTRELGTLGAESPKCLLGQPIVGTLSNND
jgi:hypothetical protein